MKKKTKVLIILNLLICLVSIVCLIKTTKNNIAINSVDFDFSYIGNETNRVTLYLDDKSIEMEFREKSVKVVNSYLVTRRNEQLTIVLFIRYYLKAKGVEITRSNLSMLGEFRLHNSLNALGIEKESSKDADLEYIKDERIYIYVPSEIDGFVGI